MEDPMKIYVENNFIIIENNEARYKSKKDEVLKFLGIDNKDECVDYLINLLKVTYLLNPTEFVKKLENNEEFNIIPELLQHPVYGKELEEIYQHVYLSEITDIIEKHKDTVTKEPVIKDIMKLFDA